MTIETTELSCAKCYIIFYVTRAHRNRLQNSKETFFCPSGHMQTFTGETEEQKITRITRKNNTSILMLSKKLEAERKLTRKLRKEIKK